MLIRGSLWGFAPALARGSPIAACAAASRGGGTPRVANAPRGRRHRAARLWLRLVSLARSCGLARRSRRRRATLSLRAATAAPSVRRRVAIAPLRRGCGSFTSSRFAHQRILLSAPLNMLTHSSHDLALIYYYSLTFVTAD